MMLHPRLSRLGACEFGFISSTVTLKRKIRDCSQSKSKINVDATFFSGTPDMVIVKRSTCVENLALVSHAMPVTAILTAKDVGFCHASVIAKFSQNQERTSHMTLEDSKKQLPREGKLKLNGN